jgi:SAM-dependent methyltransferase
MTGGAAFPARTLAMNVHDDLPPSRWVARFASLVPPGARVLDLAAGRGRHARLFAARGARVLAVDRDAAALAGLRDVPNVTARVLDLEAGAWPLAGERFDAIVVTSYLHRPHFASLRAALADDGVLLYETFAQGNEVYGRPAHPDHLLLPGELLRLAALPPAPLTVVAFEQGRIHDDGDGNSDGSNARPAVVARLAAVGVARGWPAPLPAAAHASGVK